MADRLTSVQRSGLMAKVRSKNTKPELILRSGLHRLGFRYSLHCRELPGKPDLVFRPRHKVIFVHGCFWHSHQGCNQGQLPKSNQDFWGHKIEKNIERDTEVLCALKNRGWSALVIWGCQLRTIERRLHTIREAAKFLKGK